MLILNIILIIFIKFVILVKIFPGDYLDYDSNFEDENINEFEQYHHIVAAHSALSDYTDEYSGIHYISLFCVTLGKYSYGNGSIYSILNQLLPEYKEKTRLLGLITNGCAYKSDSSYNNFPVKEKREDSNISYSAIFRLANTYEYDMNITIDFCSNYYPSSGCLNSSELQIPSQGFIKYHLKWDDNYVSFKGEDDTEFDKRIAKPENHSFIVIQNLDPPVEPFPVIYLTSMLLRVEMFKYKLALSGNRMNYCNGNGCINTFYCVTSSGLNYCTNSYYHEPCYLKGCIPGAFCDSEDDAFLCRECDIRCRTCSSTKPSHCTSCYNTAVSPQWYTYNQFSSQRCTHEYIPFNKFQDFEVKIPLLLNYRATIEFWMFIVNPEKMSDSILHSSYSAFIFKKFFTIVIYHNIINIKNVEVTFLPFENLYPYSKNIANEDQFYQYYTNNYGRDYQYVTKMFNGITSKWFYVRVGFSYTHKKMFVNEVEKDLNYPKFYNHEDITYQSFLRTFYRKNEKGILRVQGFQYVNTDFYIRNFNVYADYLNININNPNYFYMHNLTIISISSLLFSIPFNDILISNESYESTFTSYDYSNQFTEGSSPNQVLKQTQKFQLIPSNDLRPSKNFRRIKFLNGGVNKEYSTTDLKTLKEIKCGNSTNGLNFCYDEYTPYSCKENYNLFFFIDYTTIINYPPEQENLEEENEEEQNLEEEEQEEQEEQEEEETEEWIPEYLKDVKCVKECKYPNLDGTKDIEFMRLPSIKINQNTRLPINSDVCNYQCDENVIFCPYESDMYHSSSSINYMQQFKCKEGFTTLFYQCLNESEYLVKNSGLQFSSTYRTKSIYFPLVKENESPISNYIVQMWFHPDLLTQKNPPIYKQFIFLSDTIQIYFDYDMQQYVLKSLTNNLISINELGMNIYYYGWNHLIIISKTIHRNNAYYTQFNVSLTNSFSNVDLVNGINTISKICFCNIDENCCGSETNATWLDMFVKDLKLWDARYVASKSLFDFQKFSYVIPGGLIHWYKLDVQNLNNNEIICQVDNNYKAEFPYDNFFLNPYNDQNYNYGFNFNWNDIHFPKYIKDTLILEEKNAVNISSTGECNEGCLKCYGESKNNCFECQENYSLNGATCTLNREFDAYFYYLNPLHKTDNPSEDNDEFELDFSDLNLDEYYGLTIFFYMKVYGFTIEQMNKYKIDGNPIFDIIYFLKDYSFKLSYDSDEESLKLILNNEIQFKYQNFLQKMSIWIPVSISAFRSKDLTLQKHFVAMTVHDTPLEYYFSDLANKEYKKFSFDTFKFAKNMIGHISDITLFSSFIINAFGYALHKDNPNSIFSENPNGLNMIIKQFPLKYKKESSKIYNEKNEIIGVSEWENTIKHCLDEISYIENINENIKSRAQCTEDYLAYTDQDCKDKEYVNFNTEYLPPNCVEGASKCSDIDQIIYSTVSCDYMLASCDNWSVNSIRNLIFLYEIRTKYYIICGSANGLDIARFKENTVPNILSPVDEFKMEFWFLSQSYVGNNFGELTIHWTGHVKIKVSYDPAIDKYSALCVGLDSNDNEVSFTYQSSLLKDNKWRYVVCGVHIQKNEIYITNLQKENQGPNCRKSLTTINIPTNDLTTLSVSENSRINFGVTYIKELRLWKCYECSSDRAFVLFDRDDHGFDNVIHYFKFENSSGLLKDYKNNIYTGDENVQVQFETKDDFNGYGLLLSIPDIPNCNEGGLLYYSLKTGEGCDILTNFNTFKNDVVFPDIPASRANRYTMDFWFYVENADDFTKGFNMIYEDHITISSYSKDKSEIDLIVYCFPQGYRTTMQDVFSDDILQKFNMAQNKVSYTYSDGYSKWNYVRCGYSYDLQKYYINDEPEINIQSEIFFSNPNLKQNEKSFKMFMKNIVKLIINVSKDNFVRIFFQTINIYRDYIPQNIDLKYIKMKEYIVSLSNNYYYPLLFAVDFPIDYNFITNTLNYYITDYDLIPNTTQKIANFRSYTISRSYPSYPYYDPFLQCSIGKVYKLDSNNLPYCEYISDPHNCNNVNLFCLDNQKFFWCPKNTYLDINNYVCNQDCPSGYTKPSDIVDGYGMCYIKASDLHYSSYPNSNNDLLMGNYETKFECEPGYLLVNYHCIRDVSNTAIYFSNKYYFTNTIASFNKFGIKNYYVDFWVMLDLTESYRYSTENINKDENRYYLFIAFPHLLTRYKKNIQYINNYVVNKVTDVITINNLFNKWNRIVIENYYVEGINLVTSYKYVNIYLNNNYKRPVMSLKINNNNDFSLSQIAFCSGINDKWSSCVLGLNTGNYKVYENIIWEDAYYRDISVWNADSTGISSINSFRTELNNLLTTNIIAYYPFTVDTIKLGKILSKVKYKNNDVDFEFRYNTEIQYDHTAQVNWVNNFDITIPNEYIVSIDNSYYYDKDKSPYFSLNSNSYVTNSCSPHCKTCFKDGDNCINCESGYLLEETKCMVPTNYYFKTPVANGSNEPIQFNFDFSSFNEVTFMVYMKFMGVLEVREGIIPLIYFYDNKNYFGWDFDNNNFIVLYNYYENKILFRYNNSKLSIGKWSLYSLSIYHTQFLAFFPNMIQLMIDNLSLSPLLEINDIHKEKILYNKISFSNIASVLYYDLRIYNKFFIGAYSLGQEYDVSREPHLTYLQKRYILKSNLYDKNCLSNTDVNVDLGNTQYCIGDYNIYDDINYECVSGTKEKFRIIDNLGTTSSCNNCNNYCNSKCFAQDIKGCLCSYDSSKYLLRYIKSANIDEGEKIFYCQKPESLNLNEFSNIKIENIAIGQSTSYMVEFWFFIHSYMNNNNFKGASIEWTHFIKININTNDINEEYLDILCYPYSDESKYEIKEELTHKFNEWNYVKCIVDFYNLLLTLNNQSSTITNEMINDIKPNQPKTGKTTLILSDNSGDNPYGVFLLRELRIWETKSNTFYDTSHINLVLDSTHPNLVHYYKNLYKNNLNRQYIFDDKNNIKTILNNSLISPYPYSYLPESYIDLILCEEGETYKLNKITNKYECSIYDSDDIVESLSKDKSILSPLDLNSKVKLIYEMAVNDYVSPLNPDDPFYSEVIINDKNEYEILDTDISISFCSNKGYVRIVDHTPTCLCNGDYTGKYCQLTYNDYTNIFKIYELFFEKIKKTFKQYKDNDDEIKRIYSTLNYLMDGIDYLSHDPSFIDEIVEWLSSSVIFFENDCNENYIQIVDKVYRNNFNLINYYKVGNMFNGKGNSRNSELSSSQQSVVDTNNLSLKRMIEHLTSLCFTKCVNNEWNFKTNNLIVDLIQVKTNFDVDSFLEKKKTKDYLPYFKIGNCINEIRKSTYGTFNIQFITWINSPYYWNPNLYWNYTSHYVEIKLYNDDLSEIIIDKCEDKNKIEFYFTLYNPLIVDMINKNRQHFSRENMFASDHDIFTNPKYIDKNGKIDHSDRDDRIKKYYFDYIFQFGSLNAKTMSYDTDNLLYETLTNNNYLKCSSNHLSEFILNYLYNPYPTKLDGRMFFLNHFSIFKNGENYKKNSSFYLLMIILILYFTNLIYCYLINKKTLNNLGNIRYKYIHLFLLIYVYPYGNVETEYVVNKETGNKIINEEYDEENKSKSDKKTDFLSINEKRKKDKNKKNKKINKNFNINLGNVKSKYLYSNYLNNLKSSTDGNLSSNTEKLGSEDDFNQSIEANNNIKRKNSNFFDETEREDQESQYNNNISSQRNKLYMSKDDLIKNRNTLKKKDNSNPFIHHLKIANETQRTKQYLLMKIEPFTFFKINCLNRIIYCNTWKSNATYGSRIKSLFLPLYLQLMIFINIFIYIFEKEELSIGKYLKIHSTKFILFVFLSIFFSNGYFYIKAIFYNIDNINIRSLLHDLEIDKKKFNGDYRKILKKIKYCSIFETILFFILWVLNFIFGFGLSAVYYKQSNIMLISFILGITIDLGLELIIEIIITLLYKYRYIQLNVIILDKLNRFRSFKMLSP